MKTIKKTAKVETAYGKQLATPVEFSYDYEELQDGEEVPAKENPDADEIRSFVNQKRNATARSKAQAKALSDAGIEKPTLEDPAEQLKLMVKALVASGKSPEVAEQVARGALGMSAV